MSKRRTAFTAVLLDLDDTILVEKASADATFASVAGYAAESRGIDSAALHRQVKARARELWHGMPEHAYYKKIGISSWEALWGRFEGEHHVIRRLRGIISMYREESWHRALMDQGVDDRRFAAELALRFFHGRRTRHVLFDDTLEFLNALRGRRYHVALLTNGASDIQREKIDGAGLSHFFDAVLISGDVGAGKPDPAIFSDACDALGTPPGESVMLGNSLETDIAGAKAFGITAVWLNREGAVNDSGIEPDYTVTNLREFLEYLSGIDTPGQPLE